MAPVFIFLISSGSTKNEPRCVYLSEDKASHSHKMWTEVSSSVPHFLQVELLLSPITYTCLLKVLFPVRRPITALGCVLLKDNNLAFVARLGPEIISKACLCVLQRPRHNTKYWFSIQHFIFLLVFCLETPKKRWGPTILWTEPSHANLSAISFPRNPPCLWTQCSPTLCRVEISFVFCYCRTNGDVVLATWSAFRAAWPLSEPPGHQSKH